ncbi:unnamed protein product, partial [Tetraodon nigroviridis]
TMKGKERSPIKKRSRAPDDGRDRGGIPSATKKTGSLSSVGSNNGAALTLRRGSHNDKRDAGDADGYNSSNRSSGYDCGSNPGSKAHGGADAGAESSRSGPRGDARPPTNPESEYKTLKISQLGSQLNDEEVEDGLFHEFKRFGDVSIKIGRENDERVAFVNFRRPDDARAAKHARGKLVLYDRPLKIEAVYMQRRRSRSPVLKDTFSAGQRALHTQRPLSPSTSGPEPAPTPHIRDLERDREFCMYDARNRPPYIPECAVYHDEDLMMSPQDDHRATRTLFLGNLDITLTENDLRRAFARFGMITEVDIKRPARGQSNTYGFIKFENLDVAHRAKMVMSGKVLGHSPIKIGYGKPTPSTRLWVGGLGPWVSLAALAKEFDRFGTIRTIDYAKDDVWAYIQYESLDAAQAACTHMRGFPLGGPDRRLRVDFADAEHCYQQQPYMPLPLPLPHFDVVPDPFAHRLTDPLRLRERSPPFPARFRDRDLYPAAAWPGLGVHDRLRGAAFDPADHLDRRSCEAWSAERDFQSRDLGRKRRPVGELSPAVGEHALRRHGSSLEHSPGGSSWDGGRGSDSERPPRSGRNSPVKDRQDGGEKRRKALSPSRPAACSDKNRKQRGRDPSQSPTTKDNHSSASSASKSSQQAKAGGQRLSQVWLGDLLLKNSSFSTSVHLLEGDMAMISSLLLKGSTGQQVSQLKISQRLRLDQPKLDEVSRRIRAAGPNGCSVLLAVPGKPDDGDAQDANASERPLRNLVSYLKQKEAAGIVSLPRGGRARQRARRSAARFPPLRVLAGVPGCLCQSFCQIRG